MLFWTNLLIDTLLIAYVIVCVLMGLVIMMQRSKQEGLGAAFGGGFTEQVWGAQTSKVLVKATVVLAALFFFLSISLARLYSSRTALQQKGSPVQQDLFKPIAPASTNALTPVAPTGTTTSVAAPAPVTPAPASAAPATPATSTPSAPAKPAAK